MSSTNMEVPVLFKIGEENKPVIYGLRDYGQSIFKPQLDFFFSHVRRKMEQEDVSSDIFNDVYDNNIIAFIGERDCRKWIQVCLWNERQKQHKTINKE